jgi:hypothetical protein
MRFRLEGSHFGTEKRVFCWHNEKPHAGSFVGFYQMENEAQSAALIAS